MIWDLYVETYPGTGRPVQVFALPIGDRPRGYSPNINFFKAVEADNRLAAQKMFWDGYTTKDDDGRTQWKIEE